MRFFCDHIEVTEFMSSYLFNQSLTPTSLCHWSPHEEAGREGTAPFAVSEHWTLYPLSMTLVSPRGIHVSLSAKEMRLIVYLLARDPHPVQREDFIELMGVAATHIRRVDATIYRLRMKILKATGQDAPFKTLYGQGYQNDGMVVFGRLPDLK
jgi:DNA-binding response OmpR family regulator